jgi:hypothetical protein
MKIRYVQPDGFFVDVRLELELEDPDSDQQFTVVPVGEEWIDSLRDADFTDLEIAAASEAVRALSAVAYGGLYLVVCDKAFLVVELKDEYIPGEGDPATREGDLFDETEPDTDGGGV